MKTQVTQQTGYNIIWTDAAIRQHYAKRRLRYALPKEIVDLQNAPEIVDLLNIFKGDYARSAKYFTPQKYNGIEAHLSRTKTLVKIIKS